MKHGHLNKRSIGEQDFFPIKTYGCQGKMDCFSPATQFWMFKITDRDGVIHDYTSRTCIDHSYDKKRIKRNNITELTLEEYEIYEIQNL